jgi:hypothetical protein
MGETLRKMEVQCKTNKTCRVKIPEPTSTENDPTTYKYVLTSNVGLKVEPPNMQHLIFIATAAWFRIS